MKPSACPALLFSSLAAFTFGPAEADLAAQPHWPQFRGPGGSGVSPDGDFPVRFGPDTNVVWKVPLPSGRSSPCIHGDRIFLTAFEGGELVTLCLDRSDGKTLWMRSVTPGKLEAGSRLGSPAAPTPAADGEGVHVYFGSFGLIAYGNDGEERWRRPLPVLITGHGASSSPVLAGDRLVLARDADVGSSVLAVDRRTGEILWKTERPGCRRGFATPLIWPRDDPRLAILPGTLRLVAYDLGDGSERWAAAGLPNEIVASPVAGAGLVFALGWTTGSGYEKKMPDFSRLLEEADRDRDGRISRDEAPAGPARANFDYIDADKDRFISGDEWTSMAAIFEKSENALLAVRPDGRGDVTGTGVAWKVKEGLPYVASPLFYEDRIFLIKNGGIASSFDARTGKVHYLQVRIGAFGDFYSSPIAAGGKILVASQKGEVAVLRSGDALEVLALNDLGEEILATPAVAGNRLYLRTDRHLYAFGEGAGSGGR